MKAKTIPELRRTLVRAQGTPAQRRAALVELIARAVNDATSSATFGTFFMDYDRKRADRFLRGHGIL